MERNINNCKKHKNRYFFKFERAHRKSVIFLDDESSRLA